MAPGVRVRGPIAYVPRRDHFFALDARHEAALKRRAGDDDAIRTLAELGICETEPATPRRAFFGRSVVGQVDALP